eukprot:jgi/Pico_ML_1/51756/g317.t1
MAGDRGFDPLRFCGNKKLAKWYQEAELMNGRWSMAAVAGILFTDLIGKGPWWEAGAKEYFLDTKTLLVVELAVMAVLEAARLEGFKKTGECGVLGSFPFDPLGMKSEEMKVKEVKNGRLAMLAFLGFCSQAAVTGMGPIEGLKAHIADPFHNNIYTSKVGNEFLLAVIVASAWPMYIAGKNALSGGDDEEFRPIPW